MLEQPFLKIVHNMICNQIYIHPRNIDNKHCLRFYILKIRIYKNIKI
jgi:hypothetical protein